MRKLLSKMMLGLATCGLVAAMSATAMASPAEPAQPFGGVWASNNSSAVATAPGKAVGKPGYAAQGFWSSEGHVAYCAGDSRRGPSLAPTAVEYPAPVPITKPLKTTLLGTINSDQLSAMAYVLNRHGVPTTKDASLRAQQMEAVDHALGLIKFGSEAKIPANSVKRLSPGAPAASRSLAATYVQEATSYAGILRTGSLELTANGEEFYDLTGVELLTPKNVSVPGIAFSASIDGPAVWERTQTSTFSGSTGAAAFDRLRVTGSGRITVEVTYPHVPDSSAYLSTHPTYQNVFLAGRTHSLSASGQVANRAVPKLATQVGATASHYGEEVFDTLNVTGGAAHDTLEVTAKLFYSGPDTPETSQTIPQNALLVGTVTSQVTLDSHGRAQSHRLPALVSSEDWLPGYYTWVVALGQTEASSAITSDYGVPAETFILTPHTVTATTQTSHPVATQGELIYDTVTVSSDTRWQGTVEVTSKLWGPFETEPQENPDLPNSQFLIGESVGQTVVGHELLTDHIKVTTPGWYAWSTHIPGGPHITGWESNLAEPGEVTLVRWSPRVTTVTSQALGEPGVEIFDHLSVTGLAPGADVEVVSTLWGPLDAQPAQSAQVPQGTPIAATVTTPVTADQDGQVQAQTEGVVLQGTGWYVWTEQILEDRLHEPWQSPWAVAQEITHVVAPPVEEPEEPVAAPEPTPQPVPEQTPNSSPVTQEPEQLAQTGTEDRMLPIMGTGLVGLGLLALAGAYMRRYRSR